jgi:Flp pilus assembly protein CpaB
MKTFFLWFIVGLGLAVAALTTLILFSHSARVARARGGWDLKLVIVASRDVLEGQALTFDDLTQRSIPSRFLTGSVVMPDDVTRVVGRAPSMPLKSGDLLLWAAFTDYSATDECFGAIAAKVNAAKDQAREGALSRFEGRIGAPLPKPEPVPVPQADASGEVAIVVLKAQVPEGQVLEESACSRLAPR